MFISYAQNFEDVMLYRAFKHIEKGFYIDVGAQDPIQDSVTKAFYERGWRGINLEPVQQWFDRLQQDRPDDINLQVVASAEFGDLQFYEVIGSGQSTTDSALAEQYRQQSMDVKEYTVSATTLNSICTEHNIGDIHFLKIDVEGGERAVLQGINLFKIRPRIILVEATEPNSPVSTHEKWEQLLTTRDYFFAYFDGLNRYYVAKEHSELCSIFQLPPNFFDEYVRYSEIVTIEQNKHLSETLGGVREELAENKQIIDDIYQSYSWRITRPLRYLNKINKHYRSLIVTNARRSLLDFLTASVGYIKAVFLKGASLSKQGIKRFLYYPRVLAWKMASWASRQKALRQIAEIILRKAPFLRWYVRRFLLHPVPAAKSVVSLPRSIKPNKKIHASEIIRNISKQKIIYYWIDHTVQCQTNTGVQRVTRCLARALLENDENIVFVKWHAQSRQLVLASREDLHWLSQWHGPQFSDSFLANYAHADKDLIEVQHSGRVGPGYVLVPEVTHITAHSEQPTLDLIAYSKAQELKVAFTFYDAIPLKLLKYQNLADKHSKYMQYIALADLLMPISEYVANDLLVYYRTSQGFSEKTLPAITPILLAGENYCVPRSTDAVVQASHYTLLCVGTIEPRKNQILLVEAFNALTEKYPELPLKLVLVGNLDASIEPILRKFISLNSKIEYKRYISDEALRDLYAECRFTVFPSVEEGFGLPIIESLWFGKPCVCANFGSMSEIAADGGCLTLDTRELDELLAGLESLITDESLLKELTKQAVSRPIKTWNQYANECISALDAVGNVTNSIDKIYYWIDHTCNYPANSGIQRVVRGLAKALQEINAPLIPIKWDAAKKTIYPPSAAELEFMSGWNGPVFENWAEWSPPSAAEKSWLLVPELTLYLGGPSLTDVIDFTKQNDMHSAVIFYDAIPYKLKELYPVEASTAHAKYMKDLLLFDKVLSISQQSHDDLNQFLCRESERLINIEDKLSAVSLPGEFLESERITDYIQPDNSLIRILTVGTLEPRKNHTALLEAFVQVLKTTQQSVELILVGGAPFPDLKSTVEEYCNSHPNIRWVDAVDDSELQALYSQSHFTVYPSLEEGFGLPILESLWNARPCICRNSSAMLEVAAGGGCITVDTTDTQALVSAMLELINNAGKRMQLAQQAIARDFKTWHQYAFDIVKQLAAHDPVLAHKNAESTNTWSPVTQEQQPLLSLCITTYNRADWLSISLENIFKLLAPYQEDIEFLVCDNASTDHTQKVVEPYIGRPRFRYYRNRENVGMLGNLQVTAHHAVGQYIWILGDDDLISGESIKQVLQAIKSNMGVSLIYLNYAYTRIPEANQVKNIDTFFKEAKPIVPAGPDKYAPIKEISTLSENFFTAIYCLVFRRDHGLRAYTQNTSGRPFSTLLTCIPTSYYVFHYMSEEMGYWIGEPTMVVNMNVSWDKYAPLWILERIPELYDLAEKMGADPRQVDKWRKHTLPGIVHFLEDIFANDPEGNIAFFSIERLFRRYKHIEDFRGQMHEIARIYKKAFEQGKPGANCDPDTLFSKYGLI